MSLTEGPSYEVLAIRYATRVTSRQESFYRYEVYQEPDATLRMDYYFWVVRNTDRTVLIDTGFHPEVGERRGRMLLIEPLKALAQLDIRPQDISDIVLTHLHYDHTGNLPAFPDAILYVPGAELDFWTGPYAGRRHLADHVEPAEIAYVDRSRRHGRVRRVDGEEEILPGIRAQVVGGHCPGQQITTVSTRRGSVVLASDTLHYYEEMDRDTPFAIFSDLIGMYRAYDILRRLEAKGDGVIVAGHDPAVMQRFPSLGGALDDLAVRLA